MTMKYPWAEHPEEMPRRAVVVGINEYADKENIPKLEGAERDASEIRDALLGDRGGFAIPERHFLLGEKATCTAIRQAISDLFWASEECYLSLFYFSGHGIVDSYGNLYLATHDVRKNEPFIAGINQDELQRVFFNAKNSRCGLLVLDCCYSGIATKGTKGVSEADTKAAVGKFLKTVDEGVNEESITGRGKMILASCGMAEESREICSEHKNTHEIHPHGAFTFHLLEALAGQAKNEKNMITLARLKDYVDTHLLEKGIQTPESCAVRLTGEGNVRIAVASEEFYNQYKKCIDQIEDLYKKSEKDPTLLLGGIEDLNDILIDMPTDGAATKLKKRFNAKLDDLKDQANSWLVKNMRKYKPQIPIVWEDLLRIVTCDDMEACDQILKADENQYALISYLFDVTTEKISPTDFVARCVRVNNPRSTSRPRSAEKVSAR